jgi:hypothetical protein
MFIKKLYEKYGENISINIDAASFYLFVKQTKEIHIFLKNSNKEKIFKFSSNDEKFNEYLIKNKNNIKKIYVTMFNPVTYLEIPKDEI